MRVTVDLDYPSELQKLKTYFNMKTMGFVEVNESSFQHGLHMVVSKVPISFQQSLELRRWLGDDLGRIDFDDYIYEAKPKQVLFTKKDEKHIHFLDEGNILALPFYSKMKAKKIKDV